MEDYSGRKVSIRGEYFVGGHGLYLRYQRLQIITGAERLRMAAVLLLSVSAAEAKAIGISFEAIQAALLDAGENLSENRSIWGE
ncbi:MAG: hypothetical protein WDO18_08660 [Acidobacteriota bacterium]